MTYEMQMDAICDHRVHREAYYVDWQKDKDLKTIRIFQSLANQNVRLWRNDKEVLPNHPRYGWRIEPDEFSVYPNRKSKIVFNLAVGSYYDYFELSYTVGSEFCRKCYGFGMLFDHAVDRNGKFLKIQNEDKLIQQITKWLITLRGSNPFFKFIGTNLPESIFEAIRIPGLFQQLTYSEVTRSLEKLKNIHSKQVLVQQMTLREILATVNSVTIEGDPYDPRVYTISVVATTAAGDAVQVNRELLVGENSSFNNLPRRATGYAN